MAENFTRLKKRQGIFVLCTSLLLALFIGLAAGSVYVIAAKISVGFASYLTALIIGASAFIAVSAVLLILFMPTDKRAAKRLDEGFGMREGVRTMLEFKSDTADMAQLQRRSTEGALADKRLFSIIPKKLLLLLIIPAVSVSLLVTALLVPAKVQDDPDNNGTEEQIPVFELTDWHIAALRALIEEVRASKLEQSGKSEVIASLEDLIETLTYVDTVPEMKEAVIDTMLEINGTANELNTFVPFVKLLAASSSSHAKKYAEALGSLSDPIDEEKYQAILASVAYSELSGTASGLASALTAALGSEPCEDGLYTAVSTFAEQLSALSAGSSEMGEAEAMAAFALTLDAAAESISAVMNVQYTNRSVCDGANKRLAEIFGISEGELPDELKYADGSSAGTVGGDYEQKDDDVITDGGKGTGEVIYGSDDCVFNPETDEHVPYGEILAYYDAIKSGELDERTLSDEMREFIEKYFGNLYYSEEDKK